MVTRYFLHVYAGDGTQRNFVARFLHFCRDALIVHISMRRNLRSKRLLLRSIFQEIVALVKLFQGFSIGTKVRRLWSND